MTDNTEGLLRLLIVAVYNLSILAGTAYLVEYHYWSAWWFLFAAITLGTYSKNDK